MRDRIDFTRLDAYLSGEGTPEDRERMALQLTRDGELRDLVEALRGESSDPRAPVWDTERAWNRLHRQRPRRPVWQRAGLAAAAMLVIALGVTLLQTVVRQTDSPPASVAAQEYRTARGERREVRLPDGSTVTIAAGSVLRVPVTYPGAGRDVHLEGEAFFEVVADRERPFTVFTPTAETRVLGTSFNVNTSVTRGAVEVVVVTGRVLLKPNRADAGGGAILGPGQAARLEGNAAIAVRNVDVNDYIGWREGRLVFRDASLEEVVATLERWYQVDFEIADAALANAHVTAFFERPDLNEVIDVLAQTLGARYERSDTIIRLYRQ